jgi:hypothetical protein
VRPAHVKKLKLAIQQDPETIKYNPILVNEKLEVIDGQHRLEAIKQLGLDVYYVKVDGLKLNDVQLLNSVSKNWQPLDYAKAFATLGNVNYEYYLDVKQGTFSLNHDSLLRYLSLDNPITSQSFNEGKLKVDNYPRSLDLLGQLFDVGQYYERYKIRSFALAFLRFATSKGYDHKRMLQQIKSYGNKYLEDYSKEQDYFIALNKIYNHAKRQKVHFGSPEYLMA